MLTRKLIACLGAVLLMVSASFAQVQEGQKPESADPIGDAGNSLKRQLEESLKELETLRANAGKDTVERSKELSALESELVGLGAKLRAKQGEFDRQVLDLGNLEIATKNAEKEATFLSALMGEFRREFESMTHMSEKAVYSEVIGNAKKLAGDQEAKASDVMDAELLVLESGIERLDKIIGGYKFAGEAVDSDSKVQKGTFLLLGPTALFRSADGSAVGTADLKLNKNNVAISAFKDPEIIKKATAVIENGKGEFPLDPTLGDAHLIAATEETFLEHVSKGGRVMWAIGALAGVALLIALIKWISLSLVRRPGKRQMQALLSAVEQRDPDAAEACASQMRGPMGRMLESGAKNLSYPLEVIEETMYEKLLTTKMKLGKLLPFIAICAASAPLLGLLGTVTGIIDTFKMITLFGSGDVKSLSGGISTALITTKFGLIVAIPALMLHAWLSRKARGVVGQMETAAMAFMSQVRRTPICTEELVPVHQGAAAPAQRAEQSTDPLIRREVSLALRELLGQDVTLAARINPPAAGTGAASNPNGVATGDEVRGREAHA